MENTLDIEDVVLENGVLYIPVLDYPFSMHEVTETIKGININKGYSGICSGSVESLFV